MSGETILVVDDSMDSLSLMNEALTEEGYTVLLAVDGAQAIVVAERMAPDLVLMDAVMPNVDGFEACSKLKELDGLQDVPVLFLTGLSESEQVIRGLEAGGTDYISKPVNIPELRARIRVHLEGAQKTRSARSAIEELGQASIIVDPDGAVVWSTTKARLMITSDHTQQVQSALKQWLGRRPEKSQTLNSRIGEHSVRFRYHGQTAPGHYLLRIIDTSDSTLKNSLKIQFELTEREAEVLLWLSRGKTNREIGQILSTSPRTINKQLEQVFKKLSVENRTTAAAVCLEYLSTQN